MAGWQFWLAAGGMVVAVAAVLLRARHPVPTKAMPETGALPVYRDQLAEIDRDLARGMVTPVEAGRMRLEVQRRLLAADSALAGVVASQPQQTGLMAVLVIVLLAGAVGAYQWLGAPGYPDLPLLDRIAAAEELRAIRPDQATAEAQVTLPAPLMPDADYAALLTQLRATVATRPDDITGLTLLARNEANLGNFAAALAAQQALIAAMGADVTAQVHADLAEIMVAMAGGYVSPEAEAVLTEALTLDANNGTARYYAGLMLAQVGRFDLGFRMWQPLAEGAADAAWMPALRAQMPDLAARAGVNFTLPTLRGPTVADIDASADLTPEARMDMIAAMVAQLSDRLATTGGPPEDWVQLITALRVLDEDDRATAILTEARSVFAANPAALAVVEAAAP